MRNGREADGDRARRTPLVGNARGAMSCVRETHARRTVDHEPCRQQRAIVGETDECTIASREQLPVQLTRIIALPVQPILRELAGGTALA
jgi:hypothetical protein